jgi:peptide subunit release factor 1 (eRF1)
MLQDIDLRELAELEGPERAVVSLYCAGEAGRNSVARRERRIREMLDPDDDAFQHFEETMRVVHEWLDAHPPEGAGQCVFASWAGGFLRGYTLDVAPPDALRLGPAPWIRPLAELQEEYESFLIVVADSCGTRLLLVTDACIGDEQTVKGHVKNRVRKGGWSQKRYARRRSEQLGHYADDVVERIAALHDGREFARIVMLGAAEALREIEEHLPQALQSLVIGKRGADVEEGDDEILDRAFEMFWEEERREERELWKTVQDEYLSAGLGAVGGEDVLDALRQGRVDAMIVNRDAKLPATHCRACDEPAAGEREQCPHCGADDVFAVGLVDTLTRLAEKTGAEVEFVDPIDGLTRVGGVAALLRW